MERRKISTYNHLPPNYVATERQYSHWMMSKLSRSCFTAALHTSSLVDEVACIHSAGAQQRILIFTPV